MECNFVVYCGASNLTKRFYLSIIRQLTSDNKQKMEFSNLHFEDFSPDIIQNKLGSF